MNSTLKTRGITAIVFIAVMIFGIFFHSYSFIALMGIIIGGCIWEFLPITTEKSSLRSAIAIVGGIAISSLTAFANLQQSDSPQLTNVVFVFMLSIIIFCIYEMSTKSTKPFQNIAFSTFSLAYYAIFLSSIFFIAFENGVYSSWKVFALIALTWTNDTMAYMVGSQVGKRKMFERMSPNKTWEGTIGGVLFTVFVAFIFHHFIGLYSPIIWLGLAIIIGVFGTLGDLVESMLKRSYSVKDTGSLLPGHGGLLDRFDSLTFHLPISVYFIQLSSSF